MKHGYNNTFSTAEKIVPDVSRLLLHTRALAVLNERRKGHLFFVILVANSRFVCSLEIKIIIINESNEIFTTVILSVRVTH